MKKSYRYIFSTERGSPRRHSIERPTRPIRAVVPLSEFIQDLLPLSLVLLLREQASIKRLL